MLDDFGHEMENTQSKMENTMNKIAKVMHLTSGMYDFLISLDFRLRLISLYQPILFLLCTN